MNKYFVITDGDVRMVAWGDPELAIEASPMVLCPPVIPGELVDQICDLIKTQDPNGKLGEEMIKFIEAKMKAEEASPEYQGLSPNEPFEDEDEDEIPMTPFQM